MFEVKFKLSERIISAFIVGVLIALLLPLKQFGGVIVIITALVFTFIVFYILNKIIRKITFGDKMIYEVLIFGKVVIKKEIDEREFNGISKRFKNWRIKEYIKITDGTLYEITDFNKVKGFKVKLNEFFDISVQNNYEKENKKQE